MHNDSEFYNSVNTELKETLNHPVPEILIKENKRLNSILKTKLGEKNFNKDLPKGEEGEIITRNILQLKGYKVIKKTGNSFYDTIMEKDNVRVSFEIKTDFICGYRKDNINVALEVKAYEEIGSLLKTKARYIGYVIPRQDIAGFISTIKIQTIIRNKIIEIIKNHIIDCQLEDEQKDKLKLLLLVDWENFETYDIIMHFYEFLPLWYEKQKHDKGYKIATNSGDKGSGGINLLMPFEEFLKEFRTIPI